MKPRGNVPALGTGGALLAAALAALVFFDRASGGILFLASLSLLLDGIGRFHPLFAFLFPLLALLGAAADASRGLPGAALRWFVGAGVVFALGRVLRRRVSPGRGNSGLDALAAEPAALKACRERGEIGDAEFRARRDAAVAALRRSPGDAAPPSSPETP